MCQKLEALVGLPCAVLASHRAVRRTSCAGGHSLLISPWPQFSAPPGTRRPTRIAFTHVSSDVGRCYLLIVPTRIARSWHGYRNVRLYGLCLCHTDRLSSAQLVSDLGGVLGQPSGRWVPRNSKFGLKEYMDALKS